jgi:hypothetical protein
MQSTSVDVVSVKPAAGAELIGHAVVIASLAGTEWLSKEVPALGTLDCALAVPGATARDAQTTAKVTSSALRFLILVSIMPPCYLFTNSTGFPRKFNFRIYPDPIIIVKTPEKS